MTGPYRCLPWQFCTVWYVRLERQTQRVAGWTVGGGLSVGWSPTADHWFRSVQSQYMLAPAAPIRQLAEHNKHHNMSGDIAVYKNWANQILAQQKLNHTANTNTHTHTHIHTSTNPQIHTYTHTHIHTYTHTQIHPYTHTHTHTPTPTHTHIPTHIHTSTTPQTHTYTHTQLHTYTHTRIHKYTRTRIHIHTQTHPRPHSPTHIPHTHIPTHMHTQTRRHSPHTTHKLTTLKLACGTCTILQTNAPQ